MPWQGLVVIGGVGCDVRRLRFSWHSVFPPCSLDNIAAARAVQVPVPAVPLPAPKAIPAPAAAALPRRTTHQAPAADPAALQAAVLEAVTPPALEVPAVREAPLEARTPTRAVLRHHTAEVVPERIRGLKAASGRTARPATSLRARTSEPATPNLQVRAPQPRIPLVRVRELRQVRIHLRPTLAITGGSNPCNSTFKTSFPGPAWTKPAKRGR